MTKTLGIIGAGMIGGTLARLGVAAGLHVILSNSRGPESLTDLGRVSKADRGTWCLETGQVVSSCRRAPAARSMAIVSG
ncbi:NAD(P)-binding domain-containing protein [Streptomyces sp. NPDC101225]|uniref:NAD(P)-binding domain-containing protein n=1 Tax=Streptomyces sp. NPDC101225 TaxID=3366135 RepID=UPI00380D0F99